MEQMLIEHISLLHFIKVKFLHFKTVNTAIKMSFFLLSLWLLIKYLFPFMIKVKAKKTFYFYCFNWQYCWAVLIAQINITHQ
jgi:hypothetical protein